MKSETATSNGHAAGDPPVLRGTPAEIPPFLHRTLPCFLEVWRTQASSKKRLMHKEGRAAMARGSRSKVNAWQDLVVDAVTKGRESAALDPREIRLSSLYQSLQNLHIIVANVARHPKLYRLRRQGSDDRTSVTLHAQLQCAAGSAFWRSKPCRMSAIDATILIRRMQVVSLYFLSGAGLSTLRGLNSLAAGSVLALLSLWVVVDQR